MAAPRRKRAERPKAPPAPPRGKITLETPPELPPSDEPSALLASLLPMAGSLMSAVMVAMSGSGLSSYLGAAMFVLSSLGFVGVNGWRQRSQARKTLDNQRREYIGYLAGLRKEVRKASDAQFYFIWHHSPGPGALSFLAAEGKRVGERTPTDEHFLFARCGLGDHPSSVELIDPEIPFLARTDPFSGSACDRFLATYRVQHNLPVGIDIRDFARIEIVGANEENARALARAMVCNLAFFHDVEDLRIAVVADPEALPDWEWAKWLPQVLSDRVSDAIGPARMIAPVFSEIADMLPASLTGRPSFERGGDAASPHLLLVLDGYELPPGNGLIGPEGLQGVTILDLPAQWGQVTDDSIIRLELGRAVTPPSGEKPSQVPGIIFDPDEDDMPCQLDQLSAHGAEVVARYLRTEASKRREGLLPGETERLSRELVDLLRLPDIRDIDFEEAWAPRSARDRLRVPIGVGPDGRPVFLDLKEAAEHGMGPHGLLIGATGSGKSEVLRTLVLGLALTHSPEDLNFVLIDYKGGATFAGMADMPHVSAVITNLGEELALVDRMQDALQGEMIRRQELLRAAGNFANMSDYNRARATSRPELAPLPALLIVADEFSELLEAKSEFSKTFLQIGRLGRSLGMHLLLSSQRVDTGRLKGLESHLSYRIGLKTLSVEESRSIIGGPEAYELPSEPGAGYLRTDASSLVRFQAAYVSGPPPRRRRRVSGSVGRLVAYRFTAAPVVAVTGGVEAVPEVVEEEEVEVVESRSTFEVGVGGMVGLGPRAHVIWLEPLVEPVALNVLMPDLGVDPGLGLVSEFWRGRGGFEVPVGVMDRPLEQRRETLVVSLSGAGGHFGVVGSARTGKSTFLRTLVVSLALTYTPVEVQFYVLDFGGGSFTPLRGLAHVAGVASRTDVESVRRVVAEVRSLLNDREMFFREAGIDSVETYRRRRALGEVDDGFGDVFLVVDGWGVLRSEFEELQDEVADIASRGLTYGVHLVVSALRWLDIRGVVKDLLGSRVELRLGDVAESVVGKGLAGNVPVSVPGRGLEMGGYHFLGALPRVDSCGDVGSLGDGVEGLVAAVNGAWLGPVGPKLRLLPECLLLSELRERVGVGCGEVLLGLDEVGLAPVGFDPGVESCLFVYGDSGSGKSSLLRGFAHEVMRLYSSGEAQMFVVDYRRSLLGDISGEYLSGYVTGFDQAVEVFKALVGYCKRRLPGPDVTAEQLRDRSWWRGQEVFVLVDDYDLVATSQGNPLVPLVEVLTQAGDIGLHLVLARRSGGAGRASYDPVIQRLTDLGATGVLLSGNPDEGGLIGRVKPVWAVPGRARIVSRARGLYTAQLVYQPKLDTP